MPSQPARSTSHSFACLVPSSLQWCQYSMGAFRAHILDSCFQFSRPSQLFSSSRMGTQLYASQFQDVPEPRASPKYVFRARRRAAGYTQVVPERFRQITRSAGQVHRTGALIQIEKRLGCLALASVCLLQVHRITNWVCQEC